jgi:hypothetical protein
MAKEFNLLGDNPGIIQRLLTEGKGPAANYMREA